MAEKKGFDLGAMLASVSEPDTGREQIVYIKLGLIGVDPKNFYSTEEIESLAASIAMIGLQQPLRLRPDPESPEKYMPISGHRRRLALGLLEKEDPEKWGEVPCIIEKNEKSGALQQLKLIFGNSQTRTMSAADTMEQAAQVYGQDVLWVCSRERQQILYRGP